jgi:hypothetical protein
MISYEMPEFTNDLGFSQLDIIVYPAVYILFTTILFSVRVAVFPVHISVTYPIASTDYMFFTSKLSFFNLSIEKAIAMDTDNGRPSGTATMMIATAIEKKSIALVSVSFSRRV